MFCKHCGTPLNGTHCPACGRETILSRRSTDLERIMAQAQRPPQPPPVAPPTFQPAPASSPRPPQHTAAAAASTSPTKRKHGILVAALLLVLILGAALLCQQSYQKGYAHGFEAASAAMEAAKTPVPPTETPVPPTETPVPPTETPAETPRILCSRWVNNGSQGAPSILVKRIQQELIRLGYLRGTADGLFGPQTEKAVKAFQQDNILPQTGEVDQKTFELLCPASTPQPETTTPAPLFINEPLLPG